MNRFLNLGLLTALTLAFAPPASAWWNQNWTKRVKLTFLNGGQAENLANFPVLVQLDNSRLSYADTQNAGQDIRFVDADDTTPLAYEIDTWNEGGTSFVWVKVPQIDASSNSDFIWMYYGNATVGDGQDADNTWEPNYRGVWHLKEDPGGAPPQLADSSGNNNDGTSNGMNAADQQPGKIDGNIDFDGFDDWLDMGTSLNQQGEMTVSAWVRPEGFAGNLTDVLVANNTNDTTNNYVFEIDIASRLLRFRWGNPFAGAVGATPLNVNTFYHVVGVRSGSPGNWTATVYVNGAQDAAPVATADNPNSGGAAGTWIGFRAGGTDRFPDAEIDEARVESTARSAAWIRAQYLSMNDNFISFGGPAPSGFMRVKSGSYTGNGIDNRSIHVGFQPNLVIVDMDEAADSAPNEAVIRTSTMAGDASKAMDEALAIALDQIESLDANGFTVGTNARVNQAARTYRWVAFQAAPGKLKVGSYGGDGVTDNRSIGGVGFQPEYVIVMPESAANAVQRSSLMPGDLTHNFEAEGFADMIQALETDGFQVGLDPLVNAAGVTYHYAAWNATPGEMAVGVYTGDGVTDNRDITGVGFFPEYVIVKRSLGFPGDGVNASTHKMASTGVTTDRSLLLNSRIGEPDNIQALQADGFQVGLHERVNKGAAPNTYYWMAFGPHPPQINYRSIGNAPDLTGTLNATQGSVVVTDASANNWLTANRGRGDRIRINVTEYVVDSVLSETQLQLTTPFAAATGSYAYTISRQAATLAIWEDCIDGPPGTACAFFPVATNSLVADDRSEVGILYPDGSPFAGGLVIDAGLPGPTDATHTITLTVAARHRHDGTPGSGVVIDNGANLTPAIQVQEEYATVEWLEIRNGGNPGGFGIDVFNVNPGRIHLRNNLIHNVPTYGIMLTDQDQVTDVYNNIVYSCDIGLRVLPDPLQTWTQIRILNNTFYGNLTYGINSSANTLSDRVLLRNNIAVSTTGTDYAVNAITNAASSHNLSRDPSAGLATVSPGGFALVNQNIDTQVLFVNKLAFDFHIQPSSTAANQAADLSGVFTFDVDGGSRVTPWDIGADDILATTEVELASFTAAPSNGAVELRWETASELNNLGFHLHRSTSAAGPYQRITSRVIPGLGSSPTGARYRHLDSGLTNGTTYFYKLEDIETTGLSTMHGPVSAIPSSSSSAPPETGSSLITYGNPQTNSFRVLSNGPRGVVLELVTEGFYAEPQDDGTVRIQVPGFETLGELGIPVLRPWVDAVAEQNVAITSLRSSSLQSFTGLRPAGAEAPEIFATRRGTVRAAGRRRGAVLETSGFSPEALARLSQLGFQGDSKKAQLELAPLRWNGSARELVLARRLEVHLSFSGHATEAQARRVRERNVLAQLVTTQEGLYALHYEALFTNGPKGRGGSLDRVALSRLGKPVSFHLEPQGRPFGPGSQLYFLSEGADANPYGLEAVYELETASGLPMGVGSAKPFGQEVPWYRESDDYEENRLYQAGLLDAPDLWLWDMLLSPVSKSFSFQVKDLKETEPARITVWLQGVSDSTAEPDHHVRLYVNEVFQDELFWDGKKSRTLELTLRPELLRAGENLLTIENVGDTEAPYSMVLLDRFQVVYPRSASSQEGALQGSWPLSGAASVSELGASLLLDVTEKNARWLTGAEVSSDGRLLFRAEAGRGYLAVSRNALKRPVIRKTPPSKLSKDTSGADYLVIGPSWLFSAAKPLLDERARQGLHVKFTPLEDITSELGHGEMRPEAIREFLSFAYHHWKEPKLRYVLLLGDATYDFKDYLRTGIQNQLPPLMVKTSYLWTVSDPALAAVHGDDLLPDLAIGRLPARNAEELGAMVAKILAYEGGGAGLENLLVLVNDNPDRAGDFAGNADEITRGVLAGKSVRRLSLNELGGSMRSGIRTAFDEGASLMSYVGHGGIHLWADENVWNVEDVSSLASQPQQPILLTMNCLNGYFHFPFFNSLSEELLKARGKGAIAAFSPSGLSLNEPAHRFHLALLDVLFHQSHQRLGDAVLDAQEQYAASGAFPELLTIYHLLGDPALKLR